MKSNLAIVVDDERIDRYIARRALARSGAFDEILESPSGDKFLAEHFPDPKIWKELNRLLVLMDINMPGRNGFETVREMQVRLDRSGEPANICVVMHTSSDSPADRATAGGLDLVQDYIVKPIDRDDLKRLEEMCAGGG